MFLINSTELHGDVRRNSMYFFTLMDCLCLVAAQLFSSRWLIGVIEKQLWKGLKRKLFLAFSDVPFVNRHDRADPLSTVLLQRTVGDIVNIFIRIMGNVNYFICCLILISCTRVISLLASIARYNVSSPFVPGINY